MTKSKFRGGELNRSNFLLRLANTKSNMRLIIFTNTSFSKPTHPEHWDFIYWRWSIKHFFLNTVVSENRTHLVQDCLVKFLKLRRLFNLKTRKHFAVGTSRTFGMGYHEIERRKFFSKYSQFATNLWYLFPRNQSHQKRDMRNAGFGVKDIIFCARFRKGFIYINRKLNDVIRWYQNYIYGDFICINKNELNEKFSFALTKYGSSRFVFRFFGSLERARRSRPFCPATPEASLAPRRARLRPRRFPKKPPQKT